MTFKLHQSTSTTTWQVQLSLHIITSIPCAMVAVAFCTDYAAFYVMKE